MVITGIIILAFLVGPAGFTCWPGGSSVGVIAGTTKG